MLLILYLNLFNTYSTIVVPPWITVQPTNKTVSLLDNFTISCEGEGFGVKYEWRRHNGSIRSASINQTSLTISQVLPSDEDQYYCIATTEGGVNISQIATLTVNGNFMFIFSILFYSLMHMLQHYNYTH